MFKCKLLIRFTYYNSVPAFKIRNLLKVQSGIIKKINSFENRTQWWLIPLCVCMLYEVFVCMCGYERGYIYMCLYLWIYVLCKLYVSICILSVCVYVLNACLCFFVCESEYVFCECCILRMCMCVWGCVWVFVCFVCCVNIHNCFAYDQNCHQEY